MLNFFCLFFSLKKQNTHPSEIILIQWRYENKNKRDLQWAKSLIQSESHAGKGFH